MNAVHGLFSATYAQARRRFLDAAAARSLPVETHVLPLPGVDGETLAVDVVLDGDPAARWLVMTTSACHGVEGYCGSAIQTGLLRGGAGITPAGGQHIFLHSHLQGWKLMLLPQTLKDLVFQLPRLLHWIQSLLRHDQTQLGWYR
jgi:hypothetical protein